MSEWFNPNNYQPKPSFRPIPVGEHRVRIAEIEETQSSSGKDMIKVTLDVSGYPGKLFYNIVKNEWAQKNIGDMIESLGMLDDVKKNGLNLGKLVGKVGGVKVRHREWNGDTQADVHWWIRRDKVDELPAWQSSDTEMPAKAVPPQPVDDSDIPF